jgi:3-hydroxy-9,10-secoandrosta-1,3,5(10)-triene-9,17-dione monooxygenase reductase component
MASTPAAHQIPARISDPGAFRRVLGHFASGVVVVTASGAEGPVGITCQSFSSLSLDPPLVLFCPRRESWAWQQIQQAEHFCVNILHEAQEDLCRVFASPVQDKFSDVRFATGRSGAPVIEDVLGWIDCTLENVVGGGDHDIAVGRVLDLGVATRGQPLLYYRGDFGRFEPRRPPDWADAQ